MNAKEVFIYFFLKKIHITVIIFDMWLRVIINFLRHYGHMYLLRITPVTKSFVEHCVRVQKLSEHFQV